MQWLEQRQVRQQQPELPCHLHLVLGEALRKGQPPLVTTPHLQPVAVD